MINPDCLVAFLHCVCVCFFFVIVLFVCLFFRLTIKEAIQNEKVNNIVSQTVGVLLVSLVSLCSH